MGHQSMGSSMNGSSAGGRLALNPMSYVESGPPIMKANNYGVGAGSTSDNFSSATQQKKPTGASALKWDQSGKMVAGTDIGEEPLPGGIMSDDDCKRHGLPKGARWLDEEAAKNIPHPLFDPSRQHINWDELPTGLSEAMASASGMAPRPSNYTNSYGYGGQIPESECQPRSLNLGNDEGRAQLISLQHQFGGSGMLGNVS